MEVQRFAYRFGSRLIDTFNNAVMFVIALQANALILNEIRDETFDVSILVVILILILISMVLSYIHEKYSSLDRFTELSTSIAETKSKFAHHYYQN